MNQHALVVFDDWAEYYVGRAVIDKLNRVNPKLPLALEATSWSTDADNQVLTTSPVYAELESEAPSRIKHFFDMLVDAVKVREQVDTPALVPVAAAGRHPEVPISDPTVFGLTRFYGNLPES
jgi:hypothetical protein